MAYENITLRKQNVTMVDGYFYMMDQDQDAMIVKTDDGTQAYSYPLDTTISNLVVSMEWDGRNFWTLENPGTDSVYIKRWNFENYVLKMRDDFEITEDSNHKFDSDAMAIEHYHLRIHSDAPIGSNTVQVYQPKTKESYFDLATKLDSGMTISLGPNSDGHQEDKTVVGSISVSAYGANEKIYQVQLNSVTTYAYDGPTASGASDYYERYGSPSSFNYKIWLFNNYDGLDNTSGRLYSMGTASAKDGLAWEAGGEYQNVAACTFFDVPNYIFDRTWQSPGGDAATNWPKFNSIAYVRTTNLIFLNPDDFSESYGSMTMDNLDEDQARVLSVYDLTMEGVNVYRLQLEATYYGSTHGPWSSYNYQLSTLEPFITSISLRANPAILPANGVNVSQITAIVKDQFNLPIEGKPVYFTEDDPDGSIVTNPVNTDVNGVALTAYEAGYTAREVKITATAQQGGVETPQD